MEQIYTPKQDYKVLVRCATYNQSKYIEDALNGFAMQKTDFPFVCLVVDDCSTDGEQDVIKAWMERECDMTKAEYADIELSNVIIVPHKTNPTCTYAFYLLKKNMYGKPEKGLLYTPWQEHCEYEAICEGDDFWINPLKLQRQFAFMENNQEFSLCGTNGLILWEKHVKQPDYFNSIVDSRELTEQEVLNNWMFPTASLFYRIRVADEVKQWVPQLSFGDVPLIFTALKLGKIYCFSDIDSVYRKLYGGSIVGNFIHNQGVVRYETEIKLCYEQFDIYSDGRFHKLIDSKLKAVNDRINVYELKMRCPLCAAILYPKFVLKKIKNIIIKLVEGTYRKKNTSIG